MQGVRFESFARVFSGDVRELSRTRQVNAQSAQQNDDCGETRFNVHAVEEEPVERFINDVQGSDEKQAGFDKRGKVLELAVAVGVALVRGEIRNAQGKKSDDGGHKVEPGMQGFAEDAEAAGANHEERFEADKESRRTDAEKRGVLFFPGFDCMLTRHALVSLPQFRAFLASGRREAQVET